MNVKGLLKRLTLMLGVMALGAVPAWADGDSSADVRGGFVRQVQTSQGAILRVNIDRQGREQVNSAEIRVVDRAPEASTIATAFAAAPRATGQPSLTRDDISSDSSTWGWYWGSYGSYYYPYYYSYYYPSYYYYGSYYPYYYSYYYSYYPYRYYYYYRYW